MGPHTRRLMVPGPVGALEVAIDEPSAAPAVGQALICHPHPVHGGTLDNKVVQTLARAFLQLGLRCVRFNVRGAGASEGVWDEGRGEVDDAQAVWASQVDALPQVPWVLAGFSFGGHVAAQLHQRLSALGQPPQRLVLVGPATANFHLPTVPAHTLVIHGEADDVVPLSATLDWARPQTLPVTVVPGGGHFFHGQLPLLKSIVLRAWGVSA